MERKKQAGIFNARLAYSAGRSVVSRRDDGPRRVGFLRFLTCGSVDDGKSTLIGRLLFDCRMSL